MNKELFTAMREESRRLSDDLAFKLPIHIPLSDTPVWYTAQELEKLTDEIIKTYIRYEAMDTTNCKLCKNPGMGPSHNGSTHCESGSIASGGSKSHCSCDVCF